MMFRFTKTKIPHRYTWDTTKKFDEEPYDIRYRITHYTHDIYTGRLSPGRTLDYTVTYYQIMYNRVDEQYEKRVKEQLTEKVIKRLMDESFAAQNNEWIEEDARIRK